MLDKPAVLRSDLEIGIYGTHATDIAVPKLKMHATLQSQARAKRRFLRWP